MTEVKGNWEMDLSNWKAHISEIHSPNKSAILTVGSAKDHPIGLPLITFESRINRILL